MRTFVDAVSRLGRKNGDKIAADVSRKTGMDAEIVKQYWSVFFAKGSVKLSEAEEKTDTTPRKDAKYVSRRGRGGSHGEVFITHIQ